MLRYVKLLLIILISGYFAYVIKNLTLTIILICFAGSLMAQQFIGTVLNKTTNHPLAFATISTAHQMATTSADGKFTLFNIRFNDTIRVTSIGYQAYTFTVYHLHSDTIYVEPEVIQLQDVLIFGPRSYRADSLKLRKEFASAFNYQKPGYKDFLKTNLPRYTSDDHGSAYTDNSSIGGLNLLAIASLFGRNKTPSAKLQKQLQEDEEANYVDHKFSKTKVELITHMQGDSLQDFMDAYRPTIIRLKQMTDYELLMYIKESYTEFVKTYKHEEHSIFSK